MSDPAQFLKEGVGVTILANGEVQISIANDGKRTAQAAIENQGAGLLAAAILEKAGESLAAAGRQPNSTDPRMFPHILPSTVGLKETPRTGHVALVVQFGNAVVAFDIPTEICRSIGQSMMTMSADGKLQ